MTGTKTSSPEYQAWQHAKGRCYNERNQDYRHYGAKGIRMSPDWEKNFDAFLAAMGPRPGPGYSIDRINPLGDYEPGNCRWATTQQQAANRGWCHRVNLQGRTLTIAELARENGLSDMTVRKRYFNGWPIETVIIKGRLPARTDSKYLTFNGETLSVPEWAKRAGVRVRTMRERLRRGMPIERALTKPV